MMVPAFEFGNYQVNREDSSPNRANNSGLMMNSFNEIRVKPKKMKDLNEFQGLPGFSEPMLDPNDANENADDISHTIREEQKKTEALHLVSPSKKLIYIGMLGLLAVCRSSLYPLMAAIPQPIIQKLVWRSLLVSYQSL